MGIALKYIILGYSISNEGRHPEINQSLINKILIVGVFKNNKEFESLLGLGTFSGDV